MARPWSRWSYLCCSLRFFTQDTGRCQDRDLPVCDLILWFSGEKNGPSKAPNRQITSRNCTPNGVQEDQQFIAFARPGLVTQPLSGHDRSLPAPHTGLRGCGSFRGSPSPFPTREFVPSRPPERIGPWLELESQMSRVPPSFAGRTMPLRGGTQWRILREKGLGSGACPTDSILGRHVPASK
jgi:hypothetical protein